MEYDDPALTYDSATVTYDGDALTTGGRPQDGGGPTWMPDEDDVAVAMVLLRLQLRI